MENMEVIKSFRKKFDLVSAHLNEKTRRIWVATEARIYGRGGVTILSAATGMSRSTIYLGFKDLKSKKKLNVERIRKPGGGRKKIIEKDKTILRDLESILEPATRGDPESILRNAKALNSLLMNSTKKGIE
jgi:hypothetical protein